MRPLPTAIDITIESADGSVAIVRLRFGDTEIELIGAVEVQEGVLHARTVHIQTNRRLRLTPMLIERLAQLVMEATGHDRIVLAGGARTSGARPGVRPRAIRFVRKG